MREKLKNSRWQYGVVCAAIFFFMLVMNGMSLLICDDFIYMFSFYDNTRITNVLQIVPSLWEHRYLMNGRLVAHGFAQLMLMLPRWGFDIINAAMFTLQLYLIDRISSGGRKSSWTVLFALFLALWVWCPVFGQVNIWTDGSCNYLWSTVFAMAYLYPFVNLFLTGKQIFGDGGVKKALFLMVAFCAGAYSETTSAAAVGVSILLLLLSWIWLKRPIDRFWLWAVVLAVLGYLSIYTAPAQWSNKAGDFMLASLLVKAEDLLRSYSRLLFVPMIAYVVLFIMNHFSNTDRKITALSVVFLLGSLAALGILVFASQVDDRIKYASFMYLLTADAILIYPLKDVKICKQVLIVCMVILVIVAGVQIKAGVEDIHQVYQRMYENEQYIYECKERGEMDVYLDMVQPQTKYSIAYGIVYLRYNRIDMYPNPDMARYYGINKIVGILPSE